MAAKITCIARINPNSAVRVLEVARQFFPPLPAAGKLTVKEVRLCRDGWFLVFDEFPDKAYPESAFEVLVLAEPGNEPEIPGLDAELERLAGQFPIPPGFEGLVSDDDRFRHG